MAFAIVVCRKTLIVQIYLIWAQSTIAVYIIGFTSPYTTALQRRTEYFNEAIQISVLFTTACLSDFVLNPETKICVAYIVCSMIAFHLLCSTAMMTATFLIGLKRRIVRAGAEKTRKKLL